MITPEQRAAIEHIRGIASAAGLSVTVKPKRKAAGRRGNHEGSLYQRKDGLWVARLRWKGRLHQVSSASRDECARKLRLLRHDLEAPIRTPPPTETGPDGREFVRLSSPGFRRWIYERDSGLCGICGKPIAFEAMHVDHIRPRIEGGNDHVSNFRISHPTCNQNRRVERQRPIYVATKP